MKLPLPDPVVQNEVELRVEPAGTVLDEPRVTMSLEDFKSHTLNQAELLRWVREALFQLDYYTKKEAQNVK